MTNVSNTLRVRRAEKAVNQYDVASALGISRDRYWRIEKSYAEPTAEEREALAAFFGVAPDVIWPAHAAA
jgi:transcriptional regulator with XRE-family HTH domain